MACLLRHVLVLVEDLELQVEVLLEGLVAGFGLRQLNHGLMGPVQPEEVLGDAPAESLSVLRENLFHLPLLIRFKLYFYQLIKIVLDELDHAFRRQTLPIIFGDFVAVFEVVDGPFADFSNHVV